MSLIRPDYTAPLRPVFRAAAFVFACLCAASVLLVGASAVGRALASPDVDVDADRVINLGAGYTPGPGLSVVVLSDEDKAESAENRFMLPNNADLVLPPGAAIELRYSGVIHRWLPLAPTFDAPPHFGGDWGPDVILRVTHPTTLTGLTYVAPGQIMVIVNAMQPPAPISGLGTTTVPLVLAPRTP